MGLLEALRHDGQTPVRPEQLPGLLPLPATAGQFTDHGLRLILRENTVARSGIFLEGAGGLALELQIYPEVSGGTTQQRMGGEECGLVVRSRTATVLPLT